MTEDARGVRYYPFPVAGASWFGDEDLKSLRAFGLVDGNIGAITHKMDMFNGMIADSDGPFKAWRDNQYLWFPKRTGDSYIFQCLNADGSFAAWRTLVMAKDADSLRKEAPGFMANWLDINHFLFLAQYAVDFPSIPEVMGTWIDKPMASKLTPNGTGRLSLIPLTAKCPSNLLPVFSPEGYPAFVKISEYIKEYPKPRNSVPAVVPGVPEANRLTDVELVNGARQILGDNMPVDVTAAALRRLLVA